MDSFEAADAPRRVAKPQPRGTPRTPTTARSQHNFCAASGRDAVVYGCSRPGHSAPVPGVASSPRGPLIPAATVQAWVAFLHTQSIARVVTLLTDDELTFFAQPFLACLRSQFKHVVHVAPHNPDARAALLAAFEDAQAAGERVVVHCSTVRVGAVACCVWRAVVLRATCGACCVWCAVLCS